MAQQTKPIAYTPALCGKRDGAEVEGKPWGVALVTLGEAGYRPLDCYAFESEERAKTCANALNDRLGLQREDVEDIVTSSFRAQSIVERRAK